MCSDDHMLAIISHVTTNVPDSASSHFVQTCYTDWAIMLMANMVLQCICD